VFELWLILIFTNQLSAQAPQANTYTIHALIEKALQQNLSIQIAKNEIDNNAIDQSIAKANFLPVIGISASQGRTISSAIQKFNNGNEQRRNNATNTLLQAGIALNWTLFDGFSMRVSLRERKMEGILAELNLKEKAQQVVYETSVAYYTAAHHKIYINLLNESLDLYNQYFALVQDKVKVGLLPQIDLLQLQANRNEIRSQILQNQLQYLNSKTKLNELLQQSLDSDYEVQDTIPLQALMSIENQNLTDNFTVQMAKNQVEIQLLKIRQAQSQHFPSINFNSGYNYLKNQNQVGFLLFNQSRGANIGINASWTLFGGRSISKSVQQSKLLHQTSQIQYKSTFTAIQSKQTRIYKSYQTQHQLLTIEAENMDIAKKLANITLEKFKVGTISLLQAIESQRQLYNAEQRYALILLQVKLSELELLLLNGKLLQQHD
jgi:outer membrane protein TolC